MFVLVAGVGLDVCAKMERSASLKEKKYSFSPFFFPVVSLGCSQDRGSPGKLLALQMSPVQRFVYRPAVKVSSPIQSLPFTAMQLPAVVEQF